MTNSRVRIVVSVCFGLLAFVICVFWVQSFGTRDHVRWRVASSRAISISSREGIVGVSTWTKNLEGVSSLVYSGKYAGVAVFMLTLINVALGGLLSALMQNGDYLIAAFPAALNNLGEAIFNESRYRNPIEVAWKWSAVYVAVVWVIALAIVCRKARRAETGR